MSPPTMVPTKRTAGVMVGDPVMRYRSFCELPQRYLGQLE